MKNYYLIALFLLASWAKAQTSDLDLSFGRNGSIVQPIATSSGLDFRGTRVVLNSDNTLFLLAQHNQFLDHPYDSWTSLYKVQTNGTVVSTFGAGGRYLYGNDGNNNITKHVGKLSTGEIILVIDQKYWTGSFFGNQTTYFQKLNANGVSVSSSLVPTIVPGVNPAPFWSFQPSCAEIVTANNFILVGGKHKRRLPNAQSTSDYFALPHQGFIASFNSSFTTNSGWGTAGVLDLPGSTDILDIHLSGSNLFALGTTSTTGNMRIYKVSSSGSLVTAFGGSGFITVSGGILSKMAVDGTGNVYFLSSAAKNIAKINGINGSLITSYGTNGLAATTVAGLNPDGFGPIAIDNAGRVVFASRYGNNFLTLRYTTSGAVDETFAGDGRGVSIGTGLSVTEVNDIAVDSNNDVYVVGKALPTGHTGFRAFVAKVKSSQPVPFIALSVTSLTGFSTSYGTASSTQTYSISGQNLTQNVSLQAPSGFQISLDGSSYASSLSLSPTSGNLANTRIFVRIPATAFASTLTGAISHTSPEITTRNLNLSGIVSKSTLTITALNKSKLFNEPNPLLTYSISGFRNGDGAGVVSGIIGMSTPATQASNEGTYPIFAHVSTISSSNYIFTTVAGVLTIGKVAPNLAITSINTATIGSSITLTSTSNSSGTITWSIVSGTGANISGGNVLNVSAVGTIVIRASQAAALNYTARTADQVFTIGTSTTPSLNVTNYTFTFTSASSFVLPVSSNSPGTIVFDVLAWGPSGLNIYPISSSSTFAVLGAGHTVVQVTQFASPPFGMATKIITVTGLKAPSNVKITTPASSQLNAGTLYSFNYSVTGSALTNWSVVSGSNYIFNATMGQITVTSPGIIRIRVDRLEGNNHLASFDERDYEFRPIAHTPYFASGGFVNLDYGDPVFGPPTNLVDNSGGEKLWSLDASSPIGIANVSTDGLITPLKPGTAVARVTIPAHGIYAEAHALYTIYVNKKTLTLVGVNMEREYGEPNPTLEYYYQGFVNNDIASEKLVGVPNISTAANVNSAVGEYNINLSHIGLVTSEYYLPFTTIHSKLRVTKAPLTIKAADKIIEYGQSLPTFTYSVSGFKLGETIFDLSGSATLGVTNYTGAVGNYPITITTAGLLSNNYRFEAENGTLTVEKKTLTISAINFTRAYGQANPTFTYSIGGLVNGDNATNAISGLPILTSTANAFSTVGNYPITLDLSSVTSQNYNPIAIQGLLSVTKATPTLSITSINAGQSGANINLTAQTNSNGSLSWSVVNGNGTITGNVLTLGGPGSVTIQASVATTTNFNAASVQQTIAISALPVPVISFANISKTYGDAPFLATATSNSRGNITYSIASGNSFATVNPATGTVTILGAGIVTLKADQAGTGSFAATSVTATLSIGKKALNVTADGKTRLFNTANPPFTLSYSGFVGAETATVLDIAPTATTSAIIGSSIGTYPIVPFGGVDNNYSFNYTNGTLTVTAATPSVSITSTSSGQAGSTIALSASSNSAGVVSWSVIAGNGSIAGSTLTLLNAGTVTVQAAISANGNYTATTVRQIITITPRSTPSIQFPNFSATFGDAPITPLISSNSPGTFTYSITGGNTFAQINPISGVVTILGAGTVTIVANQASSGIFSNGSATATLTINKASRTINITSVNSAQAGTTLTLTGVTSPVGGTIAWSIQSQNGTTASVSGSALIAGSNSGSLVVRADVAADANYNATVATQTITISNLTTPTITFSDVVKTFGDANVSVSASSNSPGTMSYSILTGNSFASIHPTLGTVTILGAGTVTLQVSQAASGSFAATSKTATLTIQKATRTITITSVNIGATGSQISLSSMVSPSSTVVWSVTNGTGVASISGSNVFLIQPGIVIVHATVAADANYLAASASQTITVSAITTLSEKVSPTHVQWAVYPNPFDKESMLDLELSETSEVSIHLYNTLGIEIETILHRTPLEKGHYGFLIHPGPSGAYIIQLNTNNVPTYKRIVKQ